jgi:hypothetical protein
VLQVKKIRKPVSTPLVKHAAENNARSSWGATEDLGTLRSGLDEPEYLPVPFEELIHDFSILQDRWDRGRISAEAFADALARLVVTDPDNAQWTIGARSGQWYRRGTDGEWIPTPPPEGEAESLDYHYSGNSPHTHAAVEQPPVLNSVEHVSDVGVPVAPQQPWPNVRDDASLNDLPVFESATSVLDEHGSWGTSFAADEAPGAESSTTARSQSSSVPSWGGLSELDDEPTPFAAPPAKPFEAPQPGTRVWSLRDELDGTGSGLSNAANVDVSATSAATDANADTDTDDLGLPPEFFS